MKKYILFLVVLVFLVLAAIFFRGRELGKTFSIQASEWFCAVFSDKCKIEFKANLGVYDPDYEFDNSQNIAIDHFYIQWNNFDKDELISNLYNSQTKNRWALVTVEPYPTEGKIKSLLKDVVAGQYDNVVGEICGAFDTGITSPVLIRWGHEMENVTGRYPWAVTDSNLYIEAYRHFVNQCRNKYSRGYYVWSPVGNEELNNYWPGGEFVDYVGLSIYGLSTFDQKYFGRMRSMEENIKLKIERVSNYSKPVMLAEVGISGDPSFQRNWIRAGLAAMDEYPQIKTLVYFNSKDKLGAWGEEFGIPDWRISTGVWSK